jgi:hypothetical protein
MCSTSLPDGATVGEKSYVRVCVCVCVCVCTVSILFRIKLFLGWVTCFYIKFYCS